MKIILFLISLFFMQMNALSASFKCWTNSDGVRECGNSLPPQYVKQRIQYHNSSTGTVNKVKSASKTEQERYEESKRLIVKQREEKKISKQKAYDDVLLKTYLSIDDLLLSLDWKVTTLDSQINITKGSIVGQNREFVKFSKQAALSERTGGDIPQNIQDNLKQTRQKIAQLKQHILRLEQDKKNIHIKFRHDVERFTVSTITGLGPTLKREEKAEKLFMSQLRCYNDKACAKQWIKAKQFADKQTALPIIYNTDIIYATISPRLANEYALAVSKVELPSNKGVAITLNVRCYPSREGEAACERKVVKDMLRVFYRL